MNNSDDNEIYCDKIYNSIENNESKDQKMKMKMKVKRMKVKVTRISIIV